MEKNDAIHIELNNINNTLNNINNTLNRIDGTLREILKAVVHPPAAKRN